MLSHFSAKISALIFGCFNSVFLYAAEQSEGLSKIPFKREADVVSHNATDVYLVLLLIIVLTIVLLWFVKRKQGLQNFLLKGMSENAHTIKILANKRISQHTYVHFLEVDNRKILLAENNHSLTFVELGKSKNDENEIFTKAECASADE